MRVLIIEDDERISEFIARGLTAEDYEVHVEADGTAGLDRALSGDWDAIILDLMLPGRGGYEICQDLRAANVDTPVLMLSAMDDTDNVVDGLRSGADDYLTKPFAFEELLARLETLSRRGRHNPGARPRSRTLQVADLVFDREALLVKRGEKTIDLTSLEYALLEFMMLERGKVLSRPRILQYVWGTSKDPMTNIVDVYIRRLRAKIDDGFDLQLIETVRGRGYRLLDA